MVVPNICPDLAPLPRNPIFLYLEDHFQKPAPFATDIAVDISEVWDAHASQFYEWLPRVDGVAQHVPHDPAARRLWLNDNWSRPPCGPARAALTRRYGTERAREIQHSEAFELCEYGLRPSAAELEEMFPK